MPQVFIPRLVELWRNGRRPIDRLISSFPFEEIEEIEETLVSSEPGRSIKPVLLFGEAGIA